MRDTREIKHYIAAGMIGLLIPVIRASLVGLAGDSGAELMIAVGILGLITGISPSSVKISSEGGCYDAALPLLAVFISVAAVIPDHFRKVNVLFILVVMASLLLLFFRLGQLVGEGINDGGAAISSRLPKLLFCFAFGVLAPALILPLIGPFLSIFLVLVLLSGAAGHRTVKMVFSLLLAFFILAGLNYIERWPTIPEEEGARLPVSEKIIQRSWYADGPAWLSVKEGGEIVVRLAGGKVRWTAPAPRQGERRFYQPPSASALMAGELADGDSVLLLGPEAPVQFQKLDRPMERERKIVIGDNRLRKWYGLSLSHLGENGLPDNFTNDGIRSNLAPLEQEYELVYYVDPFDPEILAGGAFGNMPAYHLTKEALTEYLGALTDDGFLIMEVPYALRIISNLKMIETGSNSPLKGRLLVYSDPEKGRDIVIVRKSPLAREHVVTINRLAKKAKLAIHYYPRTKGYSNAVGRLILSDKPRGFFLGEPLDFGSTGDNNPFFYQIQKIIIPTNPDWYIDPQGYRLRRLGGFLPPEDLPWMVVSVLSLLVIFLSVFRPFLLFKRRTDTSPWQLRFFFFFFLAGTALGIALWDIVGLSARGRIVDHIGPSMGLFAAAFWMALGLMIYRRGQGNIKRQMAYNMAMMLPASILPLAALRLPEQIWVFMDGSIYLFLSLAPMMVIGGGILRGGLYRCRQDGSFGVGDVLAIGGFGTIFGWGVASPLSRTFGFSFAMVLSWCILFISVRTLQRVPDGGNGGGHRADGFPYRT